MLQKFAFLQHKMMDARQVNLRSLQQQWERLLGDVEAPLAVTKDNNITVPVPEDVHDASIIPFMLSASKGDGGMAAEPIIDETVVPHLERVEAHLTSLEERIKRCPLQSVTFYKSILENITPEVDKMLRYPREASDKAVISLISLTLTIAVYSVPPKGAPFKCQVLDVPGEASLVSLVERITCPMDRILSKIAQIGSDPLPSWPPPPPPSLDPQETYELMINEQVYRNDRLRQMTWMDISGTLTINKPYRLTHCHHACVHYLMIEDIRRTHPYDIASPFPNRPSLPQDSEGIQEIYHVRRRRRRCRICDVDRASWVTTNDRLAPENPCLFCDTCYAALHYDSRGDLIYPDYRVYPYHYDLFSR